MEPITNQWCFSLWRMGRSTRWWWAGPTAPSPSSWTREPAHLRYATVRYRWDYSQSCPGRWYTWRGPLSRTWDHLWLMFCCVRLKVLMQGFLHFLWENLGPESIYSSPPAFSLKGNPASSEQHREDTYKRKLSCTTFWTLFEHSFEWTYKVIQKLKMHNILTLPTRKNNKGIHFQLSSQELYLAPINLDNRLYIPILFTSISLASARMCPVHNCVQKCMAHRVHR